jgi:hypothetical protein
MGTELENQEESTEASQEQHGAVGEKPQFTDLIDGKPIETWNAFYGKYKTATEQAKSFSELGDVNKVKQDLATFREWQKKVEEYQKQQNLTPDEKTEAQRQQAILKELYKVMPGLQKLGKLDELESKFSQWEEKLTTTEISANAEKASSQFSDAIRAAKIDPKFQDDIEVWLWNKMSEEQQGLIRQGDASEAIKMFNELNKTGMFNGMKAQSLPKPPLRNTPGGTPPKGAAPKSKTFDAATADAWETFSGAE